MHFDSRPRRDVRSISLGRDEAQGVLQAHAEKYIEGTERKIDVTRTSVYEGALKYFKSESFIEKCGLINVTFTESDCGSEEDGNYNKL